MSSIFNALWRILFCTIAISCTLSRISAHGEHLDRIKGLMCVLFLSGLQKEDMDVSLLMKLQRYKININDIDNTELRKTCIPDVITTPSSLIAVDVIKQPHEYLISKNTNNSDLDPNKTNITLQNYRHVIEYTQEQPNIESIMNFWRNVGRPKDTEARTTDIHKTITRRTLDVKNNATENQHISTDLNETEYVDKIIFNHYKNQHQPIGVVNKEIPEKYSFNGERIKMDHKTEPIYFNVKPHFEHNLTFKAYEKVKYDDNKTKIPTEQKIDDILKTINQFKTMLFNINHNKNEDIHKVHDLHNTDVKFTKMEEASAPINTQSKPGVLQSNYTDELVKKIAQSVKDMVLQDLRKEMQITTTTTHRVETISILQKDETYNDENVMTKVLTILQALKKQPVSYNEIKLKTSNKAGYQVNADNKYDPPKQIDQLQHRTYNLAPQIHKFKTDHVISRQSHNIFRPITFQTNSLEIPPLGIPLGQGQNPINQNIIVTTARPFKLHYDTDIGPNYSDSALMKVYPKEVIQSPLSAKFSKRSDDCPPNHACNRKNDDVIRFRLSNEGKIKYDTDYYEKVNLERIEPNNDGLSRAPRFHEKLERVDRFELSDVNGDCCKYPITQQTLDCCNEKIASRQQRRVTEKRGSYDDTHFKNFLKTQQKVTDMLEQILASKARDMPVSVETT